jgi:hypothetical protein
MTRLRILIARVKSLFATQAQDRELNEELHAHLEFLIEEKRRQGMTEEEARRAASLHFGGIAQTEETYREARSLHFLETFLQDLRYALRMLRRSPGFAAVVVVSLALGIGANTAIFSAIDAVMLRMLPVEEPQQLVMLQWHASKWPEKYVEDLEGSSFGNEHDGQSSYSFTYEIGIRMALGAGRGTILSMVMRETALIVMAGLVAGCLGCQQSAESQIVRTDAA